MSVLAAVAVPHPPVILPEIGQGEENKLLDTVNAYRAAMVFLAQRRPETVVVASPHATIYQDWFDISSAPSAHGDLARFRAGRVQLNARVDTSLASAITKLAETRRIPAGPSLRAEPTLDHGTLLPLLFLNQVYPDYKIVRVGLSGLSLEEHYRLGQCIADATGSKRVAFIASGDLSHKLKEDGPYGYAPQGPELDGRITAALKSGDFGALLSIPATLADAGAECGLRSFAMMAGALDGRAVQAELLSYEGTLGVGYAVATFLPGAEDPSRFFVGKPQPQYAPAGPQFERRGDPYIQLARLSVEHYVRTGRPAPLPSALPPEMLQQRAGTFVSLHRFGELRGCIGTIGPTTANVAEEILQNGVSAAAHDPRFPAVRPEELDTLEISVDVLGEPEPVNSIDDLDPLRYGLIVQSGRRRGLLLPALDGIDTAEQQLHLARRKAGIAENAPYTMERFEVVRHKV